jgi:hypothetical protein
MVVLLIALCSFLLDFPPVFLTALVHINKRCSYDSILFHYLCMKVNLEMHVTYKTKLLFLAVWFIGPKNNLIH